MTSKKKTIIILAVLIINIIPCISFSRNQNFESESDTYTIIAAKEFVRRLESREDLSSLLNEKWTLVYHEDNRCDGSTDGKLDSLPNSQIDTVIKIQVKNDGNAWACDKKKPNTYDFKFKLHQLIENWDRFEIANYGNQKVNVFYILGAGESDYIKIYFNENHLICKLEYRSEDPG